MKSKFVVSHPVGHGFRVLTGIPKLTKEQRDRVNAALDAARKKRDNNRN